LRVFPSFPSFSSHIHVDGTEAAILKSGALVQVVGLLSSDDSVLQQASSMFLANISTSSATRRALRECNWVEPVLKLATHPNPSIQVQALRFIINVCFDSKNRILFISS